MRVRVLFFGILKELAGKSQDQVEVRDGASVRDVLLHYESQIPQLKAALPSVAFAVNQQYAGMETRLNADDEIALLPPVSGGSGQVLAQRRYASIVRGPIDTQDTLTTLKRGEDGAAVVFEG